MVLIKIGSMTWATFMNKIWLLLLIVSICTATNYRKDGKFMIGAILPLTKGDGSGQCGAANAEGKFIRAKIIHQLFINSQLLPRVQSRTKITWATAKNGVVPDTTSNAQPI